MEENEKIVRTVGNLKKRGFNCVNLATKEEIYDYIKNLIPERSVVGFGGSMSVEELELPKMLFEAGYDPLHHTLRDDFDYPTLTKMSQTVNYYITSSNAVTEDGEIVNIDGRANRIAAMAYGPKTVILIISHDKITLDLAKAVYRARNVAAPLNAKRLKKNTPCALSGICENCYSSECICRATLILHHPTSGKDFHIILTPLKLGY